MKKHYLLILYSLSFSISSFAASYRVRMDGVSLFGQYYDGFEKVVELSDQPDQAVPVLKQWCLQHIADFFPESFQLTTNTAVQIYRTLLETINLDQIFALLFCLANGTTTLEQIAALGQLSITGNDVEVPMAHNIGWIAFMRKVDGGMVGIHVNWYNNNHQVAPSFKDVEYVVKIKKLN